LYKNDGDGTFTRIVNGPIVNDGGLGEGSGWADYDNDGDMDLFVSNGQESNPVVNFFYRNDGNGEFVRINPDNVFSDAHVTAGICWGDYDNDGDQDLFIARFHGNPSMIFRNEGNGNHWINITCTGTISNKSAIGTKVRIKTNIGGEDVWQMREISGQIGYNGQNSLRAAFGLREAETVDSIVVEWPSGLIDVVTGMAADQFIEIEEGSGLTGVNVYALNSRKRFMLNQNYPNPFNPVTMIEYTIPHPVNVKLIVYDVLGRTVTDLVDNEKKEGFYRIEWNGRNTRNQPVSSGIYIYRLTVENVETGERFVHTKKMLLLK